MKTKMIAVLAFAAGLALVSCGPYSEDDDGACKFGNNVYAPVQVWYELDGGDLKWRWVARTSYYEGATARFLTLTWFCARYPGVQGLAYVSLTFVDNGGGWRFNDEYVSNAICDTECL